MSNETIDQSFPERGDLIIKRSAIKFGFLAGFVGIISSLIFFFLGMQYDEWSKWIVILIMLILVIFGIKSVKHDNPNKIIPFGKLFSAGMLITVIMTLLSIIYFLLYSQVIDPGFIDGLIDVNQKKMIEKGLSEGQIEVAMKYTKMFMSPLLMAVTSLILYTILGAIASLIGAAIFKKDN